MNPCVKTGFLFLNELNGELATGDLFFDSSLGFHIKGAMSFESQGANHVPLHAHIRATFTPRPMREPRGFHTPYLDSEAPVSLLAISDEFRRFVHDWYPELIGSMPGERLDAAARGVATTDGLGREREQTIGVADVGSLGAAQAESAPVDPPEAIESPEMANSAAPPLGGAAHPRAG